MCANFDAKPVIRSQVIVLQRKYSKSLFLQTSSFLHLSDRIIPRCTAKSHDIHHVQFTSLNQLLHFGHQKTASGADNRTGKTYHRNMSSAISYYHSVHEKHTMKTGLRGVCNLQVTSQWCGCKALLTLEIASDASIGFAMHRSSGVSRIQEKGGHAQGGWHPEGAACLYTFFFVCADGNRCLSLHLLRNEVAQIGIEGEINAEAVWPLRCRF